jgi:amino acid adenylation domain-containing protein
VDRRRLPEVEGGGGGLEGEYVAPRSEVEEVLSAIWSQVLGVERVGINDNYFGLGGDSIRSVRVLALAKERGLDISFQDLFQFQTVGELAQRVETGEQDFVSQPQGQAFCLVSPEDRLRMPEDVEDAYPLTMLQAGMLFHSEYDPGAHIYHNVSSFHLGARFDEGALRAAVEQLVERHPVLRTSFDLSNYGEPLQLVHRTASVPFEVEDISGLSGPEQDRTVFAAIENEKKEKFDWTRAPLLRIFVHRRSEETFQFTLTEHHAILDGWSVASLLTELFHRYVSLLRGEEVPNRKPPASSFRDYVRLERAILDSEEGRDFWMRKLDGGAATKLPRYDDETQEAASEQLHKVEIPLSTEISDGLKRLAHELAVPLKSVLLAAHLRVLSVLGGERDVQTGVVSHGRAEDLDGERVLGLFLNTLPFRQYLCGGTWAELARLTFETERELLPFRRYPLARMQKELGGQSLFETAFNFTHFHVYQSLQEIKEVEVLGGGTFARTNFVLTSEFSLDLYSSEVKLHLNGDAGRLSVEQLEAIGRYYRRALEAMALDPSGRYDFASLLPGAERQKLLVEFNATARDYPLQSCIHTLFEEQAARTPDAIALIFEDQQLTYQQLNERSNQLAHYLLKQGVSTETLVGILCERSLEMIVALLATLKAGGAYVPLDPAYPQERISFMLQDAAIEVLLTQQHLSASLPSSRLRAVCLDSGREAIAKESRENPVTGVQPENLVYVIYTSGSTGQPKGAMLAHRNILNCLRWMQETYGLTAADRFLQKNSLNFDPSVWEIFWPLCVGASIVIARPGMQQDTAYLLEAIVEHEISAIYFVPSLLGLFVEELAGRETPSLKYVLCGGESLPVEMLQGFFASTGAELHHSYGPTETSIAVTEWTARRDESPRVVPIGRPLANTQVYVLDERMEPVPHGVAGELYAGGTCVGRGYLHRPELTAERFIPDPFGEDAGARLYRTGDRVRYRADGNVEFLGRVDHQVKIRGYRIEPGEIEAALRAHPSVRESLSLLRADGRGGKQLVAYVVRQPGQNVTTADLRGHLKQRLPEYMIPSAFVMLEELPLMTNGKVDRKRLPAPEQNSAELEEEFAGPRDMLEFRLAQLWEEVLDLHPVGIRHSFFELGGHSILAVRLMAKVRKAFDCHLPVATLFEAGTIERLASVIRRERAHAHSSASLVAIQSSGAGRPFFCVHPVGGSVICYASLARRLGSHHPVYALQSRGIESEHQPLKTVEEMAASYLAEVREVQAEGPYLLGGWSMGGVIAFEMARQLSAEGQSIALLAVIDSAAPSGRKPETHPDEAELLHRFLADLRGQSAGGANIACEELRATGGDEQPGTLLEKLKEAEGLLPDIEAEQLQRLFHIFKANVEAAARYLPEPYAGAITLLKAGEAGAGDSTGGADSTDVGRGWAELAAGGLRVETIPGNHYTILQKPNVQLLGERLLSLIEESETGRASSASLQVKQIKV